MIPPHGILEHDICVGLVAVGEHLVCVVGGAPIYHEVPLVMSAAGNNPLEAVVAIAVCEGLIDPGLDGVSNYPLPFLFTRAVQAI